MPRLILSTILYSLFLIVAVAGCQNASQEAETPAVAPAPSEPELIGDGVISTDRNQTFPAEDPRDAALWFSVYDDDFDVQTIMVARETADGWDAPEVASFSGQWGDRAPRFSPDGATLYFTSNRPTSGGSEAADMNIWQVTRTDTAWSTPEMVAAPVSLEGPDIHMAVSNNGFWLPSRREGTLGRSDIFRIDRETQHVTHLPAPINDEYSQPDLWISPDETWMILAISGHPSGFGGDDLYVSRRSGETWSVPENLGPLVNSEDYEYGPTLSRDGRHLYFTSHRTGSANIYRMPVEALADAPQ